MDGRTDGADHPIGRAISEHPPVVSIALLYIVSCGEALQANWVKVTDGSRFKARSKHTVIEIVIHERAASNERDAWFFPHVVLAFHTVRIHSSFRKAQSE
jgi:hypothetical protein